MIILQKTACSPKKHFLEGFRMSNGLFKRLAHDIPAEDDYFKQKPDYTGLLGATTERKITAAMRVLAYGGAADMFEEYTRMSSELIRQSKIKFCEAVVRFMGRSISGNQTRMIGTGC